VLNFLNLHHRTIVLVILILISILCWFYTITGVGMNMSAWEMTLINLNMNEMSHSFKMMNSDHSQINFLNMIFIFLMWFLMMIAMMLPTAIPFIMMFDKISKARKKLNYSYGLTFNFFISYIIVWALFSLCLTIIHIFLQKLNILNPSSLSVSYIVGGVLFLLAGIYQMTSFKEVCLKYCRNPIDFLSGQKVFNNFEAFYFGLKHGIFCVGCCWVLMLLLFYSGVMNIFWIAGLSLYIMIEKFIILEKKFNFFSGLLLILFGLKIIYFNL
jgi:predicted metal-binding membrane protein